MLPEVGFPGFAGEELTARGIRCLTLRQRSRTELARLVALTAAAWREAVTPAKDLNAGYADLDVPSPGGTAATCTFAAHPADHDPTLGHLNSSPALGI